ncbi:MAG: hypothetical protein NT118_06590 [Lentisphaerae bacterium]|nr:hypothetical protein [Lentisphaerota bacterium]
MSVSSLSLLGSYDKASKENWNLRRDGELYTGIKNKTEIQSSLSAGIIGTSVFIREYLFLI